MCPASVQAVLPQLYEKGQVPAFPVPADSALPVEKMYPITADVMLLLLQHLMHNKGIADVMTSCSSPADPHADPPAATYPAGTEVDVLADLEDIDEGPAIQPMLVVAKGRIKGASTSTVLGHTVYEASSIVAHHYSVV